MITSETLYWLTRLDGLKDLVNGVTGITVFLLIVGAMAVAGYCASKERWTARRIAAIVALCVLAFATGVLGKTAYALVPTTKEMAAIVVVPKIANSETVQELGADVKALAKEWIVRLAPKDAAK